MKRTFKLNIALLFLLLAVTAVAQEGIRILPLSGNPVLQEAASRNKAQIRASAADTISLGTTGIIDDFSKAGPYPDTAIWLDKFVYINRGYARAPVTIGVATFEGLDSTGVPYNWGATTTSSSIADYLTSKPIDLSVVSPVDTTVYLSFFYQRQGLGNDPESHDSLVLEYHAPGSGWKHVWAKKGSALGSNDSSFTYVIVPVRDTFLQKGFQFRFYNYATLLGNVDHWHIDYVYLNKNRSIHDTLFDDVAFVYEPPSLLNTYTAMPWRHYQTSFARPSLDLSVRNNSNLVKNVDFLHRVLDPSGTPIFTSTLVSDNVDPYSASGTYYNYTAASIPAIPALTGPADYTFEAVLNTAPDKDKNNDTLRHVQTFEYAYAYDDGSAEAALGAFSTSASVDLAQKFTTTTDDSLLYIDIFFDPVVNNASFYDFKLAVWSSSGGSPAGNLFLNATPQNPVYTGLGNNYFARYPLSSALFLPAGTYFFGFHQSDNWYLNVGLDLGSNTQDKVYYSTSGAWYASPFEGSLMLRPVFGNSGDFVGVSESKKDAVLKVYPNPASDRLNIEATANDLSWIISDITGRQLLQGNSASADVSTLPAGIYFISSNVDGIRSTAKFVITR